MYGLVNDNYEQFVNPAQKQTSFDSEPFRILMKQMKDMYDNGTLSKEPVDYDHVLFIEALMMSIQQYALNDRQALLKIPSDAGNKDVISSNRRIRLCTAMTK